MHTAIHVAGDRLEVTRGLFKGADLYGLSQVDPTANHLLLELQDERDIPVAIGEHIVIGGGERFSIGQGPCPVDSNPCLRTPLRPVMNEEELPPDRALHQAKLTYEQIAALDPNFESGDGVFVELKDVPDAQLLPGMCVLVQGDDRYYTGPCGNVGHESPLDCDVARLRERYGKVDRTDDESRAFIVVRDVPLPHHWDRDAVDVLIHAHQGYPLSAMDMFWVSPHLRLVDGRAPANADCVENYCGTAWQRFSWHYPPGHRWDPAADNLLTHMRFARMRLGQAA